MVHDVGRSSASVNLAVQLRDILQSKQLRIVLAESCTGGNVSATLARLPGISEWLCGSFVVYRNESKAGWLGVERSVLVDPNVGPVSRDVTLLLAQGALSRTPEADLAVAITGHLGPGSPIDFDGLVFGALYFRMGQRVHETSYRLKSRSPLTTADIAQRTLRLDEATDWLFAQMISWLRD